MSETPDQPPDRPPGHPTGHAPGQPGPASGSGPGQDDWSRLVKDARADRKKEAQNVPRAQRSKRRRGILLPAVLGVSLITLTLHLLGPLHPWPPGPSPTEELAGQMAAVNLAARAIHDYAIYHGHYPEKLADVLPQAMTIEYHATATGFELRAVDEDGKPIVVNSR
ncbi:MAG TPA: hypothetical protein VMB48_01740 [Steroidobacteraceae bacterium]|nr:hypothetical protein [Steroidobacteraceae bacterium]